jgi:hypothetical protein
MATLTRATSTLPGPTGYQYYGDGEYEHFLYWKSPIATSLAAAVVYIKPGHTFNPGFRVMDPSTSSTPWVGTTVDTLFSTYGFNVFSIEINPPFSNDSPKREPACARPWPGQLLSAAKFIQYLRENAALFGIDPSKIVVCGSSSGHTLAMLLAFIQDGRLPTDGPVGLHQRYYPASASHRPNAVIGAIGQLDWTQFVYDPTALTGVFAYDIHQYFMPKLAGSMTNSALGMHIKRSASPWWWLQLGAGRNVCPQYGAWGTRTNAGNAKNLTPALWAPGTPRNNFAGQAAYFDPHSYFGAKAFEAELLKYGITNQIIWGDSSDNGAGSNNVDFPTDTAKANRAIAWLRNTVGIT